MNKKKKGISKWIVVLFSVCVIAGNATLCKATELPIASFSLGRQISVSIGKSGNTAIASVRVSGTTETTTKIQVTMYLQKKTSSGNWKVVRSWKGEKSSYYYNIQKKCLVTKGTYRVKALTTCYNGKTKDVITRISATKTF